MSEVLVRDFHTGDGEGVARIGIENGAYYADLAPDYFKTPDEDGFADLFDSDSEWREEADNLALVAEIEGDVAGYLEATLQRPMETARWQSQRDLSAPRLFIGVVTTADRFKRRGVATRLVEAAEDWGRSKGAVVAICDTYIDSPLSVPFWEKRMGYTRRAIVLRKPLAPDNANPS
ncbi:MAG: GNAT family N-acetyltransferase [Gaiellaceae bacterium]